MSNKHNIENQTLRDARTTVSLSKTNHLLLKKLGYALECDSMDSTITKILSKVPRVYHNDTETKTE